MKEKPEPLMHDEVMRMINELIQEGQEEQQTKIESNIEIDQNYITCKPEPFIAEGSLEFPTEEQIKRMEFFHKGKEELDKLSPACDECGWENVYKLDAEVNYLMKMKDVPEQLKVKIKKAADKACKGCKYKHI